jgi:predicted DNA-binding ribbon-helix-helix protein
VCGISISIGSRRFEAVIRRGRATNAAEVPTNLSKHSLVIAGHRTSISLEHAFWEALQTIARERQVSIAALVASVDADRGKVNLSSALRVFVLTAVSQKRKQRPCDE